MTISALTSSFSAQQLFGGFGLKNQLKQAGGAAGQLGNSDPVDQIQLSDAAQAMLANANAAGTAAATPTPIAAAPVAATNDQSQPGAGANSAVQNFMNFAKESPAQRMYQQILSSLGLTQQQLDAMPPDQRKAVMDKIAQMIKEKMAEQTGIASTSGAAQNNAAASAIAGMN